MEPFELLEEGLSSLEVATNRNSSISNSTLRVNFSSVGVEGFEVYNLCFRIGAYVLYNLVFVFGLVGNLLVFYTIHYTHPRMKSVQNYFLGNLALGDLLIVSLCVPIGYIPLLWQYWPFGEALCRIMGPAQAVSVFASTYTLVALAVDRFTTIIYPFNPGLTTAQARCINVGIWIAALVTALPIAVVSRLDRHEVGLPRCGEYGWESRNQELTYSIFLLIVQYILPVLTLIYVYTRISLVVWGSRMSQFRTETGSSRSKQKTVILSLCIVLGYTVAWLPLNTIYITMHHGPEWILDTRPFPYVYLLCHFLAMSHTTFNPVIYFWINSKFRRALCQKLNSKFPFLVKVWGDSAASFGGLSWRSSSRQKSSTTTSNATGNRELGNPGLILARGKGKYGNPKVDPGIIITTEGNNFSPEKKDESKVNNQLSNDN